MERYKKKIVDKDGFKNHVIQNAAGNPIIFQSQPENKTVKANTWGFYDDDLYVKGANNVLVKFTGTVVS